MAPRRPRFIALIVLMLCGGVSIRAQQAAPAASIEISGDVSKPITVTAADLSALPQVTVMAGTTAYEGVLLEDVLKTAGVVSGSSLKGKALSTYVLAEGRDGYAVVFSLGELDSAISDGQVVLAETSGGKPLADTQGPFRLVLPKDKIGARSVRMLSKLTVVQLKK
jgi:DMSO/TMAO reductase YedYZ molybdopterin-dependent catalytic subunit